MLIIFKNRLFKTDVNCSNLKVVNTLSVVNGFYGSWTDNTTQYFQGYGTSSITSTIDYALIIPIYINDPPCATIHIDIYKPNYRLDGDVVNSDISGMNVVCEGVTIQEDVETKSTLFKLTGTETILGQDGKILCELNPCLMTDIFIGPGYIKYSSVSYHDGGLGKNVTSTTSYINFGYSDSSSIMKRLYIKITQPYVTSSLDDSASWRYDWYYSGYVKTFYGSM